MFPCQILLHLSPVVNIQLVWLITRCSSGLGEALALAALARGDKVIATARGSTSRIAHLEKAGAATRVLDATKDVDIKDLISIYDSIDVCVPNAGYGLISPIEETP